MDSIASGVDLEYMDLEYTELVLTTEHPLQHLDIPEMNFYAAGHHFNFAGNMPAEKDHFDFNDTRLV